VEKSAKAKSSAVRGDEEIIDEAQEDIYIEEITGAEVDINADEDIESSEDSIRHFEGEIPFETKKRGPTRKHVATTWMWLPLNFPPVPKKVSYTSFYNILFILTSIGYLRCRTTQEQQILLLLNTITCINITHTDSSSWH